MKWTAVKDALPELWAQGSWGKDPRPLVWFNERTGEVATGYAHPATVHLIPYRRGFTHWAFLTEVPPIKPREYRIGVLNDAGGMPVGVTLTEVTQ